MLKEKEALGLIAERNAFEAVMTTLTSSRRRDKGVLLEGKPASGKSTFIFRFVTHRDECDATAAIEGNAPLLG